jgi:hypothetical protein
MNHIFFYRDNNRISIVLQFHSNIQDVIQYNSNTILFKKGKKKKRNKGRTRLPVWLYHTRPMCAIAILNVTLKKEHVLFGQLVLCCHANVLFFFLKKKKERNSCANNSSYYRTQDDFLLIR